MCILNYYYSISFMGSGDQTFPDMFSPLRLPKKNEKFHFLNCLTLSPGGNSSSRKNICLFACVDVLACHHNNNLQIPKKQCHFNCFPKHRWVFCIKNSRQRC